MACHSKEIVVGMALFCVEGGLKKARKLDEYSGRTDTLQVCVLEVKTRAQHGNDLKTRNACLCASASGEMWPLQREVVAEVIMEQQYY